MGRLDGKVAIITGAARGQGEAEARLFAAEGAKVVVADVLADEAAAVAESIGDAARAVTLDVTDEDAWRSVVAETEEAWGPITTLVNNAGILDFNAIDKYDTERFRTVLDVNVMGCFLGIKSVVPSMKRSGNGSIVNISSNGGMEGLPYLSAYSTSKWAIRGLSRSAAIELGRRGIRVNTVHPGGIDTPMTRFGGEVSNEDAAFYQNLPIKRVGTVDDVAPVVLFLCSDEAGYVTGSEYVVDGGHLAGDATVLSAMPGKLTDPSASVFVGGEPASETEAVDTVELEVDEDEDVVDGPDDEVEPERERSGFGLLLLLTAALTIVRLVFALRAEGLTSLPDEIGYLGDAWLLGRGDPAPPMGWAPFYPASYPVLLAPVTAFTDDTATIATAARVLNVLLLAGLAPLCWALLGRLGRLRPGARAVAAVAATATPGLWVAAQRAWPDALLAVVWVAALLALWALARPGPLWRRVWFGPAVGLLLAAHSRFVPVAALAVFILVLRLAAPGRDESGRTTSRVADAVNLVGMAVVAGVGLVLDAMVDSRWEWIADSAAEQLFDEPAETLRHVPGSLVGQGWYALVATFGLAGIGVATLVTVAWRARRRDQALWTEPLPLVAATAVAGAFGVQLATAIQIGAGEGFFDTSSLDLLANGRYQEVVLVPLVLAGIARLARRVQGPLGLEVGVAVVALVLAVVVGVSLGTNPPVVDQGGAPGTTWLREVWPDQPVVAPTILLLVVLAGFVLLRPAPPARTGRSRRAGRLGLRAAAVPILALAALSIPGAERAEEIVAAGRARDAVAPDLDEVRDALDGRSVAFALDRSTAEWVADVGWALAPEGVVTYEPVRQRRPSELLVIAPADDGEPGERVPAFEGLDPAVELAELPIEDGLGRPLVLWELVEG